MFHRHQFGRQPAELVQQATMAARVEQPPVIVLAMYLHQQRSQVAQQPGRNRLIVDKGPAAAVRLQHPPQGQLAAVAVKPVLANQQLNRMVRSEEHTSELQSLMRISYAVFCLKKKKNNKHQKTQTEKQ